MNTFFVSDPHLGHKGVTEFLNQDGSKMRPWTNTEEMDEALILNWNGAVGPKDRVIVVGDIAMNKRCLPTIARCNGIKDLIMGNHDVHGAAEFLKYFRELHGCYKFDGNIVTHIPIHPSNLHRFPYNIHGHIHGERIMLSKHHPDKRYINVSVEQIEYTPIAYEDLKKRFMNDT